MTITYLSPAVDAPVGGIKVLYRHSALLNAHGFDSDVCHPQDPGFACSWFDHQARLRLDNSFDPAADFIVIPEIWVAVFAGRCRALGLRHAIFVQNGYRIAAGAEGLDVAALASAYEAADLVLSISDDTSRLLGLKFPGLDPARLLRLRPGVGDVFGAVVPRGPAPAYTPHLITFMPRKLPGQAARLAAQLAGRLPAGWSLRAIEGVREPQVAALLRESAIFLSFGDLEGLALPPLEAAFAGNLVVGYTGQGGTEYFRPPLFRAVARGDLVAFEREVLGAVREVEQGVAGSDAALAQRQALRDEHSMAGVAAGVLDFGRRVGRLLQGPPADPGARRPGGDV